MEGVHSLGTMNMFSKSHDSLHVRFLLFLVVYKKLARWQCYGGKAGRVTETIMIYLPETTDIHGRFYEYPTLSYAVSNYHH